MYNFLIGAILLWISYKSYPFIGILVPVATLLSSYFFFNEKYGFKTMIKIYLVILSSLFVFSALQYEALLYFFNHSFIYILALNIGVLILSTKHRLIQLLLLLSTLSTPNVKIDSRNKIQLYDSFIPSDYWVLLTCITLSLYYTHCDGADHCDFSKNIYFALLCIWIPTILHYFSNEYLESRALLLCLFTLFDIY